MTEELFEKARASHSTETVFRATVYWLRDHDKRSGSHLVREWIRAIVNVRDIMRDSAQKWFQRFDDRNLIKLDMRDKIRLKISEKGWEVLTMEKKDNRVEN